jgi:SpoIID/LytB domain protein
LQEAGLDPQGYPYFRVACDSCRREPERWQAAFDHEAIRPVLEQPTEAARLAVARRAGWSRLPSTSFRPEFQGDLVTLHGTGIGHGIGLCQRGAASLAAAGLDFGAILRHFFPNTSLETISPGFN